MEEENICKGVTSFQIIGTPNSPEVESAGAIFIAEFVNLAS
jgi:hypothetical protein